MLFAPLSNWRAEIGTTFIIDLWFSGIILAGLIGSALWRAKRLPALAASAVLVAYVGFQYVLKLQALEFAAEEARHKGLGEVRLQAQPRPVSPFNWTVYVSDAERHRYANINLVRREPRQANPADGFFARLDSAYQPVALARWETRSRYGEGAEREMVRSAWNSDALGFYRWFAELPAFDGITPGSQCVWFVDLRFITPGRPWAPFNYGACRGHPGEPWRAYQRLSGNERKPLD